MATIRKEFSSPRSADAAWAVLKRFDAVHELAPGVVTATRMESDRVRIVTFANGMEVREHLVSADDGARRLVYAISDHPLFTHYSAVAQVIEDGQGSRFVWTVDFLPDTMAAAQEETMNVVAGVMAKALG